MIIIATIVVLMIGVFVVIIFWCKEMRKIFLLNKSIQEGHKDDGKVVYERRKKKK